METIKKRKGKSKINIIDFGINEYPAFLEHYLKLRFQDLSEGEYLELIKDEIGFRQYSKNNIPELFNEILNNKDPAKLKMSLNPSQMINYSSRKHCVSDSDVLRINYLYVGARGEASESMYDLLRHLSYDLNLKYGQGLFTKIKSGYDMLIKIDYKDLNYCLKLQSDLTNHFKNKYEAKIKSSTGVDSDKYFRILGAKLAQGIPIPPEAWELPSELRPYKASKLRIL